MPDRLEDFEDMSVYGMDAGRRESLLARGQEAAIVWSTRDGWPVGVVHLYFWRDGCFWVTCTQGRKRVPALRARPQSSVIVAFEEDQTITAKTLATVHEPGNEHEDWLFTALAERILPGQPPGVRAGGVDGILRRLASENRVILQFEPVKWISFDGRQVKAHAEGLWKPGDPWAETDGAG